MHYMASSRKFTTENMQHCAFLFILGIDTPELILWQISQQAFNSILIIECYTFDARITNSSSFKYEDTKTARLSSFYA